MQHLPPWQWEIETMKNFKRIQPIPLVSPLVSQLVLPLVAALLLAGCASTASFTPTALPEVPRAFKEAVQVQATTSVVQGRWWAAFADSTLDALIDRADANNTSIQLAAARLAQARALVRGADAATTPQLGLAAAAQRGNSTAPGSKPLTVLGAGATASWEPDVFGRLSQASRAAALDAQARAALLQSARLLVQSDVAQSYFQLRALDDERALLRATLVAYRDTLRLTERRYAAGDVAELDLARVQTEVAATQAQAYELDRRRAQLEHALAVLQGQPASGFALPEADWRGALPGVPAGIPSAVLARRPDIAAARSTVQAAQTRADIAQTAWFPDVALTARGGFAATELADVFKWSARSWGLGALLSLPVFDGGRREAGVLGANANWEAAAAAYREQVLVAYQEVEDRLAALRLLAEQARAQNQAVAAAGRATGLSGSRYRNGLVSQLELLDAQRSELSNRRLAVQVRAAQYQATVGLVRALGGGWEVGTQPVN
jgi:multidrug efflux system outer membrane protein